MANGYDKFFKDAKNARKETGSEPRKKTSGRAKSSVKSGAKFQLDARREQGMSRAPMSPEEQLREMLAERVKEKRKSITRKRQKFPVFPTICLVVATVSAAVGYFAPESVDGLLNRVEIGFLGQASAAPPEAKSTAPAPTQAEKPAETKAEPASEEVPDVRSWSAEELSFFNKLNDRKKELDLREAELNKLEEELQRQKVTLDQKIKELEAMRTQISQTLKARVETDQEQVEKLVQFYSNMKPQQAAKVIETINEDLAVEVLDKMKKKNAAEIMNLMDAQKAKRLSEVLTGYQRLPSSKSE